MSRSIAGLLGGLGLGLVALLAWGAPDFLPTVNPSGAYALPWTVPPFGTDDRGTTLLDLARQGAAVVLWPALGAALVTLIAAGAAGWLRCLDLRGLDASLLVLSEIVGSLPRLVVVLVVAVSLPATGRVLWPIALTWTLLALPGAMDEAAAAAERLGGARFVEALRAHGFSAWRIYGVHVLGLNLRPVLVRQAAEVAGQVVFLEIALSYLAVSRSDPAWTHAENHHSWATLLYQGYTALLGQPLWHSLALSLALLGLVTGTAMALRHAARAR